MPPTPEGLVSFAFGRFQVLPYRRELLEDGQPISLGGRAFDVLMALVEARGAVISKNALMSRVWPDRVVEENNLQSQIVALRKAFGADRDLIRTISGRGYQFTGNTRVLGEKPGERAVTGPAEAEPGSASPPTNLPEPVSELIGRDEEVGEIMSLAGAHRLVTLTGTGGIGKTRLALAVARHLLPQFADGVWVAELAPLADPGLVPASVAAALGLDLTASPLSPERVAGSLAGKRLMLVLDNCEHVIDAAATMAEALLRANPGAHVTATSREPLKAEGEWVYPVPILALPPHNADDQDDPLRYGAVRLFTERARAAEPHFVPDRNAAAIIAAICRRLDGIPLAIELAAARVATLGVQEIAARLDDRFHLLTGGRRTALPRHQTLRATLDWSYELLTEPERTILRRLAIFAGAFGLDAASAVVASSELVLSELADGVANLVAKSLVSVNRDSIIARYQLLNTTRAYAIEKLVESGERNRLERRLAEYGRDVMERAESQLERSPTARQLADLGRLIDNVRANLDWAFSPAGDQSLGVALTADAIPFWMHLSLIDECRSRVEQALAAVAAGIDCDPRREMKLHAALGASLRYTRSAITEMGAAWTRALKIAEELNEVEYQLRALSGLWIFHSAIDQHRVALELAQRLRALAATRPDPNDQLVGERLIGTSQHFLGNQESARRHLERVLANYTASDRRSQIVRFQYDLRVTARALLARILWRQGFPDQAVRAAEESIAEARASKHAMSLCYALVHAACPVALWVGDLAAAEHYIGMLLDYSRRHALTSWHAFGLGYHGALAVKRGDVTNGLRLLRAGFEALREPRSERFISFLGEVAESLGRSGQSGDGLATIDEMIARSGHTEERWWMTDLLRVRGELLLLQGAQAAAPLAEHDFRQALDGARRQGALSWELRAATSLARLWRDQGRPTDAIALLQPVYDCFTEGFGTADLKSAKALLDDIQY